MKERKIIYGCMGLGGSWDTNPISVDDQKKAEKIIEKAISAEITHFDHADIYTFGKAEKTFGQFLSNNPNLREKLFIQSKTGIELHAGPFGSNRYNLSKKYILNSVDQILKRLSIEYLDALLLHRPDPLTSMEEVAETLKLLKINGKVKAFGVSNMSAAQIHLLQSYLDEPLTTNQINLNLSHSILLDREVWVNREESPKELGLNGLLAYAQKQNLSIQAYSPLAQGRFSNIKALDEKDKKTAQFIEELAEKYSTTSTGILLAWLWKIPANITPVIGTTNLERINDCIKALRINLTREDWYALWITAQGCKLP